MKFTWKNKKIKKILKTTGISLCTISLTGIIAIESYNIYLDKKLDDIEISQENISIIEEYYDNLNQDPVIFVMNDSQGINLNIGFWKNSYPEYLNEELSATVIDASSLRFNKVSHIDMLLKNNVSFADIKRLNNEGAYEAISKIATDINLPFLQSLFGNIGRSIFGQKIEDSDNSLYISDSLKYSKEPIIIYSSGANDLMFLANANPNSLKKYNYDGTVTDKFLYAENILCDSKTMQNVISKIEQNFCNIFSINPNAKIFALSIYVPKSLKGKDYEIFFQAIKKYNYELNLLCQKYNVCFIDETDIGKIYNQSKSNFHINEIGHKKLAALLIDKICENVINPDISHKEYNICEYQKNGLNGCYDYLVEEINKISIYDDKNIGNSYYNDVYLNQSKEKIEDATICKKLIRKRSH